MILRRLLILFAFCTLSTASLSAQDSHYTLHNMAPLWLNPANTGAFYGSIRVSGLYRGQWHGFSGINSPIISVDAPIVKGLRKQDWIGGGFMLLSDRAGSSNTIVKNFTGFSASYHLGLDKKQTSVLTLGVQYGSVSFGLNPDMDNIVQELTIDSNLGGGGSMQGEMFNQRGGNQGNNNNQNGPRDNYNDLNAGLIFKTLLDKKDENKLEIGFAMLHLNGDSFRSFIDTSGIAGNAGGGEQLGDNSEDARQRRATIHAHANLDYKLNDKLRFLPTLYYQSSAQNSSLSIQAWVGAMMKQEMLFKFGLGYRTGDAAKILVGLEKDRLRVAASYDIQLNQQTPTVDLGSVNSFELAANYIFNIYKKPEVKPNLICPQI
ncbi:MAG: PorP/SprF family type IX secretion system membrane protein [Bacteroidota bacterium]